MRMDKFTEKQAEVMHEAIATHLESPRVVQLAGQFAEEQGETLQHYNPRERMFTLSDGEPYTAEYIIQHMNAAPDVLPS